MQTKMAAIFWVTCFFLCVFCTAEDQAHAQEKLRDSREKLLLIYDPSLRDTAARIHQSYPTIKRELESLLHMSLVSEARVVLMEDRETFQSLSGSPFTRAFAVPRQDLIVMHVPSGMQWVTLRDVFKHELCHLLLHENISDHLLPRWLDEGICQWVSGSLGEIIAGSEPSATHLLTVTHKPFPFHALERSFPRERIPMLIAYHQSRKFVEYLSSTYGSGSVVELLLHLERGANVETAMLRVYGAGLEELEGEWHGELRSHHAVFVWLSRHIHHIIFALLPVFVVVVVLIRGLKRRRMDEEEEEEEGDES